MSDGRFILAFVVLTCLCAAGLSVLLNKRRSTWSRRKILLVAAMPLPGIVGLLCFWVFAKAWVALLFFEESCGVDACGMAIMASSFILIWTAVAYALGLVFAALVLRLTEPAANGNKQNDDSN
jgi:amino acid transporter